jgi:hypothetical protein
MEATHAETKLSEHRLVRRLLLLGLDRRHFVVFGSGPLLLHGLRDVGDLDIVARGPAWGRASELGQRVVASLNGAPMRHFWGGKIEVTQGWISPEWDVDELIDRADLVEGIRFARLDAVLAYKRFLRRDKDIRDISAIEGHTCQLRAGQRNASMPAIA